MPAKGDVVDLQAPTLLSAGSAGGAPAPALDPTARYLFYDIVEHEQLNKQRKGFMYAYTVARTLGRELVLHRLRVRKSRKVQRSTPSTTGKAARQRSPTPSTPGASSST